MPSHVPTQSLVPVNADQPIRLYPQTGVLQTVHNAGGTPLVYSTEPDNANGPGGIIAPGNSQTFASHALIRGNGGKALITTTEIPRSFRK